MTREGVTSQEIPVSFLCSEDRLYGILHRPAQASACGVLIVTGRPALRAGRHRLFVLLARAWAEARIPVMRFDFRGTGDCEGEMGTLEETSEDIGSAVDAFMANMPGLERVVLWGLCGGAADSVLYAARDPRIAGIAMVNPWTYDTQVKALSKLSQYGSNGWEKIRRVAEQITSLKKSGAEGAAAGVDNGFESAGGRDFSSPHQNAAVNRAYSSYRVPDLSKRLVESLEKFDGKILLILSGRDTGSRAFKHAASISPRWRRLLSSRRVQCRELPDSNHSLRRPEWRAQAAAWTIEWLRASAMEKSP
jgi:exosortase A-associated hydrolase 1